MTENLPATPFNVPPGWLVGLPLAIVAFGDIRRGAAVGLGMAWL